MKNLLLLLFVASIAMTSCSRRPSVEMIKQAKTDDSIIRVYLSNNPMIKAVKDPSGLYYQVVKQGAGAYPDGNSTVTVNYHGKLINGAPFDSADDFSSSLDRLVKGWQIGIPHVKKGGNILLFVPSALGYGPGGGGPIPENAVLIFDIDLVDFK